MSNAGAGNKELMHTMSKKIAQLTKVIYLLHSQNDEHKFEKDALQSQYQADLSNILESAHTKLSRFSATAGANDDKAQAQLAQLRAKYAEEKKNALAKLSEITQSHADNEKALKAGARQRVDALKQQVDKAKADFSKQLQLFKQLSQEVKDGQSNTEEVERVVQRYNKQYNDLLKTKMEQEDDWDKERAAFAQLKAAKDKELTRSKAEAERHLAAQLKAQRAKFDQLMKGKGDEDHKTINKVMAELAKLREEAKKYKRDLESRATTIDQLSGEITERSQALDQALADGKRTQSQHEKTVTQMSKRIEQMEVETKGLQSNIEHLQAQHEADEDKLARLKAKIKTLEDELSTKASSFAASASSVEKKLTALQGKYRALEQKLVAKTKEHTTQLQKQGELLAAKDKALLAQQQAAAEQLANLQQNNAASGSEQGKIISSLEQKLQTSQALVAKAEAEVSKLTEDLAAKGKAYEDMKSVKKQWEEQYQEKAALLAELTAASMQLEHEIKELQTELALTEAKATANLAQLQAEWDEAKASSNLSSEQAQSAAQQTLDLMNAKIAELQEEIAALLATQLAREAEVTAATAAQTAEIVKLKTELSSLNNLLSSSKEQGDALQKARQAALEDAKRLVEQEKAQNMLALKTQAAQHLKAHTTLQGQYTQLQKEVTEWKNIAASLREQQNKLKSDFSALKLINEQSGNKGAELETTLRSLRKTIVEWEEKQKAWGHQQTELEAQLRDRDVAAQEHGSSLDDVAAQLLAEQTARAKDAAALAALKQQHTAALEAFEIKFNEHQAAATAQIEVLKTQHEADKAVALKSLSLSSGAALDELQKELKKQEAEEAARILAAEEAKRQKLEAYWQGELAKREELLATKQSNLNEAQAGLQDARANLLEKQSEWKSERMTMLAARHEREVQLRAEMEAQMAAFREELQTEREQDAQRLTQERANMAEQMELARAENLQWQAKFDQRPSRQEDLDKIRKLTQQFREQQKITKAAIDDMKYYKMELVNREDNYNKTFGRRPNVGVMNVVNSNKQHNEQPQSRALPRKNRGGQMGGLSLNSSSLSLNNNNSSSSNRRTSMDRKHR